MEDGPPAIEECYVCHLGVMRRVWTAPHVHAKLGEFVGKFGVYKNDSTYDYLKYECWPDAKQEQKPEVEVNGVRRQTYDRQAVKGMKATPLKRMKKERPNGY